MSKWLYDTEFEAGAVGQSSPETEGQHRSESEEGDVQVAARETCPAAWIGPYERSPRQ